MTFLNLQLDYYFLIQSGCFLLLAILSVLMLNRKEYLLSWRPFAFFCAAFSINSFGELLYLSIHTGTQFDYHRLIFTLATSAFLLEFNRQNTFKDRRGPGFYAYCPFAALLILGWLSSSSLDGFLNFIKYFLNLPLYAWTCFIMIMRPLPEKHRHRFLRGAGLLFFLFVLGSLTLPPANQIYKYSYSSAGQELFIFRFRIGYILTVILIFSTSLIYLYYRECRFCQGDYIFETTYPFPIAQIIMTFILLALFGWFAAMYSESVHNSYERKMMKSQAVILSRAIDSDLFRTLTGTDGYGKKDAFQNLKEQLRLLKEADQRIARLYLLNLQKEHPVIAADSQPANASDPDRSGVPFKPAPEGLRDVFGTGSPLVTGPYRNEFGHYISAFAPVRDRRTGVLLGALGLDMKADLWVRGIFRSRLPAILITYMIIILVAGFYVYRSRRWEATEQIKQSERHMSKAQEMANIGSWIYDYKAKKIKWSSQMFRIMGVEPSGAGQVVDYAIDRGIPFVHSQDQEKVYYLLHRVMEEGLSSFEIEVLIQRPDKTVVSTYTKGEILRDSQGRLHRIMGVTQDISLSKKAEAEILSSKKRLQDIIDFLPDATFVIDHEGRVIAWNYAIEKLTGVKKEEMIGKGDYAYAEPFYGIRRPILIDFARERTTQYQNHYQDLGRNSDHIFAEAYTPGVYSGKGAYLWGTASRLYDENGKCIGAIESIRDITDREKLEQQLIQAEKLSAVGQLAAGIAHEFNNILTVISGIIQLMQMEECLQKENELLDNLKIMQEEVRKGGQIVQNMITFSSPQPMKKEMVDITGIIDEVILLQKKQLELENILVHTDYQIKNRCSVNRNQIQQVFLNLIINARHAIRYAGKGEIRITVKETGGSAEITVSDTGIGMEPEVQKRIFTPFFTTKGAMAQDTLGIKGTGLGLAVSYSIINSHKGDIQVASQKGKGTTFTIRLPLKSAEETVTAVQINEKDLEAVASEIGGRSILIVDDDTRILSLIERLLKKAGFRNCRTADSGRKALEMIKEGKADIMFLDMLLPDMNGEIILSEAKKIKPHLPVIILTGKPECDEKEILVQGASGLIRKPFTLQEILTALKKVLLPRGI